MNRMKKMYKKLVARVLSWNLKKLSLRIFALALVFGTVSGVVWYRDIYMTPERRFWSAIDNSMSTQSFVRTLTTGGSGNQVVQDNRFFFGEDKLAESQVEFMNRSATVNTSVVTEGITTPTSQFSRYVTFETDDVRDDGSVPNLDSVLGKWSGQTAGEDNAEEFRLNYTSELVTLAVFGNFNRQFRQGVVDAFQANNVYTTNFGNATEELLNDEQVIVYSVSVGLKAYAEQLQRAFQQSGLGEFPPLNPDNYTEEARLPASFVVRKRDNVIVGIQFGDRQEEYSNHGVIKNIEIPTPVFTPEELEAAVQKEIQG